MTAFKGVAQRTRVIHDPDLQIIRRDFDLSLLHGPAPVLGATMTTAKQSTPASYIKQFFKVDNSKGVSSAIS